jgi:hypothetical protein
VERGAEDVCEPSKSTPGFISESGNRRSTKGSTLRRWMAATAPAAVSPPSRNFCKASRRGWSFSCFSRVAPSASCCQRQSPLVEKTTGAFRRRSGGKTTGAATPCSKTQGWRGCTAARALPQLEGAATGPHRHADLLLPRRQGKKLRGEEMGPQIPVGANPKKNPRKPP